MKQQFAVRHQVAHIKGGTYAEGIEENICA